MSWQKARKRRGCRSCDSFVRGRDDSTINNDNYSTGCDDFTTTTCIFHATTRHFAVWPAVAANLRTSINTGTGAMACVTTSGNVSRRRV